MLTLNHFMNKYRGKNIIHDVSTVISPSWITEQISVRKCAHSGKSARRKRQISLKIVTWIDKHGQNIITP